MSAVKNDNYIQVQGWMVNELGLKGSELLIYACIYGFSQDGSSKYTGSAQYLADWTNTTKQSVFKVLKSLTERGLILRDEETRNNLLFVSYSYNPDALVTTSKQSLPPVNKVDEAVNKVDRGSKQSLPGGSTKFTGGSKQSLPNNLSKNIEDMKENKLEKNKRFLPPSVDDVRSYCVERGNQVDAETFVDFYSSKGWKIGSNPMKDWRAAVRTWEKRDSFKPSSKKIAIDKEMPDYDAGLF